MENSINIELCDFYKNSGIHGIIKMLKHSNATSNVDYFIHADRLEISKNFLLSCDLTQMYFDTFIYEYKSDTTTMKCIEKIKYLKNVADIEPKIFKENLDFIVEKLSAASLKSGFDSIKDKVNDTEIYELLCKKKINVKLDSQELQEYLIRIDKFLDEPIVKETFFFKNIVYSVINRFWENKCFLLQANAKKNMKEIFKKEFEVPFKEFITQSQKDLSQKSKKICIDCSKYMKNETSIAFLKDMADDLTRKTSTFWNFNVDAYICPICAFVYAVAPLGFMKTENSFIFVNSNTDIQSLIFMNTQKVEDKTKLSYNTCINKMVETMIHEETKKLHNIQVITRTNSDNEQKYKFNTIGSDVLTILNTKIVKKQLGKLSEKSTFKSLSGEYVNIYQDVVQNILNYRNQYNLLNALMIETMEQEWIISLVYRVIMIQFIQNQNRWKGAFKMNDAKLYFLTESGYKLRDILIGMSDSNSEDSIRGTIYQLINSLKVRNSYQYMDIIMRLYSSIKEPIPSDLKGILSGDEDTFLQTGYAFLLGLKGGFYKKEKDKEVQLND